MFVAVYKLYLVVTEKLKSMPEGKNRRKHPRYWMSGLISMAKKSHVISNPFQKPFEAMAVDFNQYGLAFLTEHKLAVGDEVVMTIGQGHELLESVVGFICSVIEEDGDYRVGVQFDFDANKHMKSVKTMATIIKIELILIKRMKEKEANQKESLVWWFVSEPANIDMHKKARSVKRSGLFLSSVFND